MTQDQVTFSLLSYILLRELVFLYSTHKFVNKIMSHNFHDYQQSLSAGKQLDKSGQAGPQDPLDIPEDLGSLEGIGI